MFRKFITKIFQRKGAVQFHTGISTKEKKVLLKMISAQMDSEGKLGFKYSLLVDQFKGNPQLRLEYTKKAFESFLNDGLSMHAFSAFNRFRGYSSTELKAFKGIFSKWIEKDVLKRVTELTASKSPENSKRLCRNAISVYSEIKRYMGAGSLGGDLKEIEARIHFFEEKLSKLKGKQ